MKKILTVILFGGFLSVAGAALYLFYFVSQPMGSGSDEVVFDLSPGSSFQKVAHQLGDMGLVRNPKVFTWYARALGQATKIQVGEYALRENMTPREILHMLASGKSIPHLVTIPEGYNIFEIHEILEAKWPGRGIEFLEKVRDPALVQKYLGHEAHSLEGYLFPETYTLTKYTTAEQIVDAMVKRFFIVYEKIKSESHNVELPLKKLVIFASIVEKETGVPEERTLVSSVFHNRLQKKMRIQSDPTIIYGHWVATGEYLRNIQRKHIREVNEYNTYTIPSLPVGPISNPGEESLRASLNPEESDYLYFVSRNDGTHVFSKNLKDHNRAVKDYQLNPKARQGKSWRDQSK